MKIQNIECTERVKKLRAFYLQKEPEIRHRIGDERVHRVRLLYLEGWRMAKREAATARMRKSMAEAYMLKHIRPSIQAGELIVGQPDLEPFTAKEQEQFERYRESEEFVIENRGRKDHVALDYQLLLDRGVTGMLELVEEKLGEIDLSDGRNTEQYEFFLCCKMELEGLLVLCSHYCEYTRELAERAEGEEKQELQKLCQVLERVPVGPAQSFREALQSIQLFTYNLFGLYSFGKPDLYLLSYYQRDLAEGRMTAEEAQELIDCFYLQSVFNVPGWAAEGLMLGGRDAAGKPVENELTWHFLRAIEHTHLPDPNVGFCVTQETGEEILDYVALIIAEGHGQPQIWNCDAVIDSMTENGFAEQDARLFTLSTCVEVTPIGCSGINVTSPMINVLKIFREAFETCDNSMSFEEIFARFAGHFGKVVDEQILLENLYLLEQARNSTDPVRCSLLIHDCIERGLSHDSGGARYNQLEPDLFGVQNVGESLNVILRLVFEEKRATVEELQQALRCNYEGYEELLHYIRSRVPHFGTGDETANHIMKRVADLMLESFRGRITARGARILPGDFSYLYHISHGQETGATPDGRTAGMPLHDGCNPVQGYDIKGPTASLMSTAFWEPVRFLGGTSVNVKLNKGIGKEVVMALIRSYLQTKGAQLQFNIVSGEELRRAQREPEHYGNLLVRIGGYSEFFVRLTKEQQDEVISRTVLC